MPISLRWQELCANFARRTEKWAKCKVLGINFNIGNPENPGKSSSWKMEAKLPRSQWKKQEYSIILSKIILKQ